MTCTNNCDDPKFDKCLFYTGVDIPELCIKNGDSYDEVTKSITDALQLISTGEAITLPDLVFSNPVLKDLLYNKEYTIDNVIQAIITWGEGMAQSIINLEKTVNTPISVNAPCLSLPTNPTKDDILKATAEKLCSINTTVSSINSDYLKASDICPIVMQCIEDAANEGGNGGGGGTIIQEYTKMPKNVAVAYVGPMSVFDATGKGIPEQGYENVYIMNGNNGTQDWRGRVVIGANVNVSGAALDAAVDPALPQNAGYSFAPGAKKGGFTHTLVTLEGPPHGHAVVDNGHSHLTMGTGSSTTLTSSNTVLKEKAYGGNPSYDIAGTASAPSLGKSSTSTTGISIGSSGGGQPHNNTQPSVAAVWIVYLA